MISSGGRANAQNTATTALQASGEDVHICFGGVSASEGERRHDRCCASDCDDEDRSTAAFRWMVGRK